MNWFSMPQWTLAAAEHDPVVFFDHPWFRIDNLVLTEWAIMLILVLIAFSLGRGLSKIPRTRMQGILELLFDFLEGWFSGFIGSRKDARLYLPILGTFFLFILFSNYSGLIPGAGTYFFPPTAKWGTTAGLGAVAALSAIYIGIRTQGFGPWIRHVSGIDNGLIAAIILFPLNLLEEFVIRPFSLSLRLFGNIFAEEKLLAEIVALFAVLIPLPIILLSVLFGGLQAVVFTTLTAIYIGGALEAARHAHGHGDVSADGHGHGHGHGHGDQNEIQAHA